MDLSLFQLLPAPDGVADSEVIAQAWWEIDTAEAAGFDAVWLTEHHLSSFGLIGTPSVFAAAVAQRTRRLKIGYAIAVVPLHHPVRLAEEIAWVDALSGGRVLLGLGPGFSAFEFEAYGVPLAERHARLEEGAAIVRGLLTQERFGFTGQFWTVPEVTVRPRPASDLRARFFRASSSPASLLAAANDGTPVLLGLKSLAEIAQSTAAYRERRVALGIESPEIDHEIAQWRVLRRVVVGASDEEAERAAQRALGWEAATARRVHEGVEDAGEETVLADGSLAGAHLAGGCVGTPATVVRELEALASLGIQHVIAWINFGNLPFPVVRRSLELLTQDVAPAIVGARRVHAPVATPR